MCGDDPLWLPLPASECRPDKLLNPLTRLGWVCCFPVSCAASLLELRVVVMLAAPAVTMWLT